MKTSINVLIVSLVFCAGALAQRASLPSDPPDSIKAELDLTYGKTAEQELKLDVYRPESDSVLPACVLVHGGGWMKGDKEKFRPLAIALAERGYVVANVEYRLGGVAKYPAGVQDCLLAVRWLRANADKYGYRADKVAVAGSSAGGHLAALVGTIDIVFGEIDR